MLSEISQRHIVYDVAYMWNPKNTRSRLTGTESKRVGTSRRGRGHIRAGERDRQTTGYKTGCKRVFYNTKIHSS